MSESTGLTRKPMMANQEALQDSSDIQIGKSFSAVLCSLDKETGVGIGPDLPKQVVDVWKKLIP